MHTEHTLHTYYRSLDNQKNWQEFWSEDAVFTDASGVLKAEGKAAVIQSFSPFLQTVEAVKLKQTVIVGEKACAVVTYNYMNARGEKLAQDVAEVLEVKNSKLQKLTLYFDLTAYRTFVKGGKHE